MTIRRTDPRRRGPKRAQQPGRPGRRSLWTVTFAGLTAACLTLGVAACSSGSSGESAEQGAEQPSSTVQSVISVDAPLNAVPTSGQDAADPGVAGPADPLVTGTPTPPTDAPATTDTQTGAPVSTAGPIEPAGNIDQIVPEAPVTTAPAVALTDAGDFGGQVTARISQVAAVQATATLPGEVAGPAVAVTVEITNGSGEAIGLDAVTVALADAAGNPGMTMSDDPAAPLQGVLEPGAAKSGTYVFTVPTDQRNPVTVTVNYSAGAPTLVFTGQVAGG